VNEEDVLSNLSVSEASLKFGSKDFPDAVGENFLMPVVMLNVMKKHIRSALVSEPKEMNKGVLELMNEFQNNPVQRILFGATPLIPNKVKKRV
jgi:hypothetical protein